MDCYPFSSTHARRWGDILNVALMALIGLGLSAPLIVSATGSPDFMDVRAEVASGRFEGLLGLSLADGSIHWVTEGEAEAGRKHGPGVAYPLASISKSVTAVAVLRLVEQERLQLDAPLASVLEAAAGTAAAEISLRQLLAHQSGIASLMHSGQGLDDLGDPALWPEPTEPARLLERVWPLPLRFTPGSRYEYSNSNYLILGEVLSAATGLSPEAAIIDLALAPAGIAQACICESLADIGNAQPREWTGTTDQSAPAVRVHPGRSGAAGGLRLSAESLMVWSRALLQGRILQPQTLEQMWTGLEPTRREDERMGLGWLIRGSGDQRIVLHDGALPGLVATLALRPAQGQVSLGFLSPTLPMQSLARSEIYLRERTVGLLDADRPRELPTIATDSPELAGLYLAADGSSLRIIAEGARLQMVGDEGLSPLRLAQRARLDGALARRAEQALKAWQAGDFDELTPLLSAQMQEVPTPALAGMLAQISEGLGAPQPPQAYGQGSSPEIVLATLPHAQGSIDLAVVFNVEGRIDGLQLLGRLQGQGPDSAPVVLTADGELWLDGYRQNLESQRLQLELGDDGRVQAVALVGGGEQTKWRRVDGSAP